MGGNGSGRPAGSGGPLALARLKYARHRAQARFRQVGFEFTFDEWYQWWLDAGVDKNDPAQTFSLQDGDRMCMCRLDSTRPYAVDNVYPATHVQKAQDQMAAKNYGLNGRRNRRRTF